jgi:hypothetical protein
MPDSPSPSSTPAPRSIPPSAASLSAAPRTMGPSSTWVERMANAPSRGRRLRRHRCLVSEQDVVRLHAVPRHSQDDRWRHLLPLGHL